MSVAVSMALRAVVAVIPPVMSTIPAIPAVAWGRRRRCVVIAGRVGVHRWSLGYLVYRWPLVILWSLVDLWPLGALGVVAGRLLCDTAANRRTCSTTCAGTHDCTVSPTHGLTNCCARGATNGTTDHRTSLATALCTDGGTSCATEGSADDCALATAHMLAQHRAGRCTYSTTQQGANIVGIDWCAQGRQRQCAAGKQSCRAHMAAMRQDRSF